MYILPTPWFVASVSELWMAAHQGDDTKYIAAFSFGCLAVLFHISQKRRYEALQASEKK